MEQSFWLVWNPHGTNPSYRHPSYDSAAKEAERLFRMNPTDPFYVLQAVARPEYGPQVRPVNFVTLEDIPF